MIKTNTNIEEIKAEIQKRVAILAQTLQGADRDKLEMETRNALNLASEGELGEFDAELLTWVMASDTEWDDIISLLKLLNDLVRESESHPEEPKCFGFAAIADTVTDEIAAAEAKRVEDRGFVRSIVNDVAGTMRIEALDRFHDDEIREGLSSRSFASYSDDMRRSIMRIVEQKISDSPTLKEHMRVISNACRSSMNDNGDFGEWDEYLSDMCPEAMKRIRESSCQFKIECKRSLTFIALRLELDALRKVFNIPDPAADDDDLY